MSGGSEGEHVQETFKARRPISQKSCLTDRDSSARENEGAADGPTEDNRAGGRDPDPEDIKTHRVPSTHTCTHGRTQMKLNEELSAAGARPHSEPRPLEPTPNKVMCGAITGL